MTHVWRMTGRSNVRGSSHFQKNRTKLIKSSKICWKNPSEKVPSNTPLNYAAYSRPRFRDRMYSSFKCLITDADPQNDGFLKTHCLLKHQMNQSLRPNIFLSGQIKLYPAGFRGSKKCLTYHQWYSVDFSHVIARINVF